MTKLTDTQLVVLSAAAKRDDGSILPLPANLKGGAAAKVVDGLIRRGLAERIVDERPAVPDLVRITLAGLEAIGVDPDDLASPEATPKASGAQAADVGRSAKAAPSARGKAKKAAAAPVRAKELRKGRKGTKASGPRAGTKQALLIEMLRRPEGATVDQIAEATGWQRHTVRGAIAGALKKKLGLTIESEKVDGVGRVCRIID